MQLDKVARSEPIYETKEYAKFRILQGNRLIDQRHVKSLAKKMRVEGSLLPYFPIIVNENLEVIDGQHRLRAAEVNGFPIYYIIKEHLNVDSVRQINTGHRNWSWYNYAVSYSELGNENYTKFLKLYEDFKERFNVLLYYSTGNFRAGKSIAGANFARGEFVMKDWTHTRKLLQQLHELKEACGIQMRSFDIAAYRFMRTPTYDHQLMLQKLADYGGENLARCWTISDFLFALEEIWRA